MKKLRFSVAMLAVLAVGILTGCSETSTKSPAVSDTIRKSLDQAGLKGVTVGQDRDKGIEKNLDAVLIQNRMHDNVKYDVKSGVVTLTGEVNSQAKRDHAEKAATNVPNVKQVVNDLQVKNQKASSSQ
jgi:osmotically-inducible protein OsmY